MTLGFFNMWIFTVISSSILSFTTASVSVTKKECTSPFLMLLLFFPLEACSFWYTSAETTFESFKSER